jgi:hypothetical protein
MIVRKEGYNDSEMLEYLNHLEQVMSKTVEVKVGRGKASKTVLRYKYSEAESVLKSIVLWVYLQGLSVGHHRQG